MCVDWVFMMWVSFGRGVTYVGRGDIWDGCYLGFGCCLGVFRMGGVLFARGAAWVGMCVVSEGLLVRVLFGRGVI